MAVTRLEIRSRGPYEDGASFGDAGAYERLDGTLWFAVDPAHAANGRIIDLDRAARNAAGLVQFSADFCLLQPVDAARANGRLLLDVVNRGRKLVPRLFNRAPAEPIPSEQIAPGDAFLLRRGWTIAWCGWQWDVVRSPALMGIEVPQALENGRPIEGQVAVQFQPNAIEADHLLADRAHQPYPAAEASQPDAVLTVRDFMDGPRTVVPRERWQFARDMQGQAQSDTTHIRLNGGFEPGRIYEAVYRTAICPVAGIGMLALRDAASFLRFGTAAGDNPAAGRIEYAFACGASQTGRLLREFIYQGLNLDEENRQVFDGLLPMIAGAHRGEFNHRYAQPSAQASRGFGQLPPFTDDERPDPYTGRRDGLLKRQRALGGVPKIVYTNTAAEYWPGDVSRGDASLVHTEVQAEAAAGPAAAPAQPIGTAAAKGDLELPPEVRSYYFAGTQHSSGGLPLASLNPLDGMRGAHNFNIVDYTPLNRAALLNLERWATAGEEPPPSAFPRLADGTAASIPQVLEAIGAIPGVTLPDPALLSASLSVDLGSEAERGVGSFPAATGGSYPARVSAVDADGNEVAGIRLPAVAVPVATYTGWNPRHPDTGGERQIVMMMGSTLPFAATAEARARTGDPRLSIEERYRDRDEYLARARAAARALAAQGYLLPDDIELAARQALSRYEAFAPVHEPAKA